MERYSVLMAVYYRERAEYLKSAIESMLNQTVPPEEFVLVCDGPLTEELDRVIAEVCSSDPELFRVIRLAQNRGLGTALREGLLQCRNELVARMDSDDLAVPDRMEKQLEAICADSVVSVLGGQIGEFSNHPEHISTMRLVPTRMEQIRKFIKFRSPMNHTTVVLRRSHILKAGNYQSIPGFEDYTLWIRLVSQGYELKNIDHLCCKVRADDGMYARRGGMNYFRNAREMEKLLLETRMINHLEYARNLLVRFAGTVLLPSVIRKTIFKLFLRRQVSTPEKELSMGQMDMLKIVSRLRQSYIKQ